MNRTTISAALLISSVTGVALAGEPRAPRHLQTIEIPTHSEGFHDWPSDGLSAIEFIPNRFSDLNVPIGLLILPDDRSKTAPARIGRVDIRFEGNTPEISGIHWSALRDEKGRTFEKNTVDPEAVRFVSFHTYGTASFSTILWASEGYAKDGVQPAIYLWQMSQHASKKLKLPDAFLHDGSENPTRGITENHGFESLAIDNWTKHNTVYAAVERPLIQDEGTGICRVLVRDLGSDPSHQLGYPLGPASEGADPATLSVAEMLSVGPMRLLVLENAKRPDGETVSRLFWCSTDGASDITKIESLASPGDATPRMIEKKLLLDFSTIPNNEGIGNFEGMAVFENRLYFIEDTDSGAARMLQFNLPGGLQE